MRIIVVALVVFYGVACGRAEVEQALCESENIKIKTNFAGAGLHRCEWLQQGYFKLYLKPENTPINNSPWYAFQVQSQTATKVAFELHIESGTPRYQPKISRNRQDWQAIDFAIDSSKNTLRFSADIAQGESWFAGQELITASDYQAWTKGLSKRYPFVEKLVGKSENGRDLQALILEQPSSSEWLLIIGRQHPPEVTGAIALMSFVEALLHNFPAFLQRFNLMLVPNLNPDGVALGYWRHNTNGVDLNRDWKQRTQAATRLMHKEIQSLYARGGHLVFALDFHSTYRDIFYTMPAGYGIVPQDFSRKWLESLAQAHPEYELRQKPGHNPDKGVFKQYIADTYGVHGVTYEVGDNTERKVIHKIAQSAAKRLQQQLMNTSQPAFIPMQR
ncbi:MAG: succinylglutamate desuccinylase/aspartoacylase family protein [Cellvibrionaceae bacterium]|nr:succinylglutamate desuccinylase/aspartoacylase family protein [Cellvibrionaceae bacterium]